MSSGFGPATLFCAECGRPSTADELARFGELLVCPACKEGYAQKLREGVAPVRTTQYAGFWIRVVAWLIDTIILYVVGLIVQFAVIGATGVPRVTPGPDATAAFAGLMGRFGIVYLINMAIACAYEAYFVSSNLSATPGKLALSLKVLRPSGERVGVGRAVGRYFAKMLSALILLIGYIMIAFNDEKQGLHDMICDTRVVKVDR